jgi:hypothetical protein
VSNATNDDVKKPQETKQKARTALALAFVSAVAAVIGGVSLGAAVTRSGSGPADCPAVGDTCSDKTIYAGRSPDTGSFMFATPHDAAGDARPWKQAMQYAADLDVNGHKDWKLPSKAELNLLYQNRHKGALKGTFDESGSNPSGWYWASSKNPFDPGYARVQRFSDGGPNWYWKGDVASVRPVRSEPRP